MASAALLHAAPENPAPTRPNIVFFLVDDMGWQDTSVPFDTEPTPFNGFFRTPSMESLAHTGTRFSQAYTCSVCSPSRVSLMSGKNASRHHVTNWTGRGDTSNESERLLPPPWKMEGLQPADGPTVAGLLQKAGYRTIHVGKAHWGAYDTPGANPLNLGFDVNIGGTAAGQPGGYQGRDGFSSKDTNSRVPPIPPMPGMDAYQGKDIHLTDALTDAACKEMETAVKARQGPFFLHLAHYAVHTPLQAHKPYDSHYKDHPVAESEVLYASMIEGMDASLGKIVGKLKELGVADETIVVFYSDNGGVSNGTRKQNILGTGRSTHNKPLREGKGSAYEGGIRVPAIVSWAEPNASSALQKTFPVPNNAHNVRPIMMEDWFPTMLKWAGATIPKDLPIDGEDLTPVLSNPALTTRSSPIIWHVPNVWTPYPPGNTDGYQPHSAIRSGDWKAIYFYESERWELYNIAKDLGESTNLAGKEPARLSELTNTLFAHLQAMKSPWPVDKTTREPHVMKLPRTAKPGTAKLSLDTFKQSLSPIGFVLLENDWHVWCSAPLRDGQGNVHLFVSRWPVKDTFDKGWHTTSEIAHYQAPSPSGPYRYVSTILKGSGESGSWRAAAPHNPTALRLPDGRYAILFIANSNGSREQGFPANQKIGLMTSASPEGPWKLEGRDGLILDVPQDPDVWSHGSVVGVNNPTLLPMPDGRFFLYYKAMKPGKGQLRRMGLAIADQVEGPYHFEKEPLTSNDGMIEDGFAFGLDDQVCLLVTDCHGVGSGGGMIYHSKDGITFENKTVRAFEAIDHYLPRWKNPAPGWAPWALQRPALLLGPDGTPTHLFAPCGTPPEGRQGTATFLFEIH